MGFLSYSSSNFPERVLQVREMRRYGKSIGVKKAPEGFFSRCAASSNPMWFAEAIRHILWLHQSQARCHYCPDAYANDPTAVGLFPWLILARWNLRDGTIPAIFLTRRIAHCSSDLLYSGRKRHSKLT